MKTSHKLIGAALLAGLGVSIALPSATKAAPEQTGAGKIKFTKDNTGTTNYPPGTTGPEIPGPINTDDLDMKVLFVSDLDFDQNKLLTNGSVKKYNALAYETDDLTNGGRITMPNFVKFQDHSAYANGAPNAYKVTAKITEQFKNGTLTMDNAVLNYKNASVVSATNDATKPAVTAAAFKVTDTAETEVISAADNYGTHDIKFGTYSTTNPASNDAHESVELEIPGTTILADGEYTAEVTWSIVAAP